MTKKEFDEKLKSLDLTRQTFAQQTGISYGAITNWHDVNKPIPSWVDSWLDNYDKARRIDVIVDAVRPYVISELQ